MPPESLREALTAAFDEHEQPQDPVASPEPTTPEPDEAPQATAEPSTETTPPDTGSDRPRDALGRFTRADQPDGKGVVAPQPEKAPVGLPEQPQTASQVDRAPGIVPLPLREQWASLPAGFKEYTLKRENEVAQVLTDSQVARQFAGQFMQAIQPYQHAIQIETGGDPLKAVVGLMDTASRLRFGTAQEKAGIISHLVKVYGVDIEQLDNALVGTVPQQSGADPVTIQRAVQQALQPLYSRAQQYKQETEQRTSKEVADEITAFAADTKNEFFGDVRDLMADAIEVAERQGYNLSLEDAYERACLLHPEVRKIIVARQNGESAQSLTQAAQRAKAAAVSVKGAAPVGNPEPVEPKSVRDAIEAAIEQHSRV